MKRLHTSFGSGIAALAMILGSPGLVTGSAIPMPEHAPGPRPSNSRRRPASAISGPYTRSDLKVHPGSVLSNLDRIVFRGNRWMAHRGDKERARHTGRPDGLMHHSPVVVRSNHWKRHLAQATASSAVTAKPAARKSRAKKAVAA